MKNYQGEAVKVMAWALAGFVMGLTAIGVIDVWRTGSLSTETGSVVLPVATGIIGIVGAYVGAKHINPQVMEEAMKIRETYPDGRVVEVDTGDGMTPETVEVETANWSDPFEDEAALAEQTDEDFGEEGEWRE